MNDINTIRRQAALRVLLNRVLTETTQFDCLMRHVDDRTMLEVKINAASTVIEKTRNVGTLFEGVIASLLNDAVQEAPAVTKPAVTKPAPKEVKPLAQKADYTPEEMPEISQELVLDALRKLGRPSTTSEIAEAVGPFWVTNLERIAPRLEWLSRRGHLTKVIQRGTRTTATGHKRDEALWSLVTSDKLPQLANKPDPMKELLDAIRSFQGEEFTAADMAKALSWQGRAVAFRLNTLARQNWVVPTGASRDVHGNIRQSYRRSSRFDTKA